MEDKEKLIMRFCGLLARDYQPNQIREICEYVREALVGYEVVKKCCDVASYDDEDVVIVRNFLLAKASEGLSKKSLYYYRQTLIGVFFKIGRKIKEVTQDDIREYLIKRRCGNVSQTTINNERRVLSTFFAWMTENDIVKKNVMLRIKKVRTGKKTQKILSVEELERVRMACRTMCEKAIVETLYSSGCRVSELCGIKIDDVDFEKKTIRVVGKGSKERVVYISERCRIFLKEYLENRTERSVFLFCLDKSNMPKSVRHLYEDVDVSFRPLSVSNVEVIVRNIGRRAGIDGVTPHVFRRTCATIALKRGMPLEQIRVMLGHESIETTVIYAKTDSDDVSLSHEKYVI